MSEYEMCSRCNEKPAAICISCLTDCTELSPLQKAAPAMGRLLYLLAIGEARFEHSKTTSLVEFCWKGLRYACSDCDWAVLVKTIGYDKIETAVAKAGQGGE